MLEDLSGPMRPAARRPRLVALAALPILALVALVALSACTITLGQPVVSNCDSGITAPVHVQTDLRTGSTIVIAAVTINGHGPYQLAVDTGASVSIVDRSVVTQVGLPVIGRPEPVGGVGGQQEGTPVQVNSWSVGQIRLPSAQVDMLDLPSAEKSSGIVGLLGSDVMRQFGVVQVDYSRQLLVVYTQVVPSPTTAKSKP